jgi:hypothetical protein
VALQLDQGPRLDLRRRQARTPNVGSASLAGVLFSKKPAKTLKLKHSSTKSWIECGQTVMVPLDIKRAHDRNELHLDHELF